VVAGGSGVAMAAGCGDLRIADLSTDAGAGVPGDEGGSDPDGGAGGNDGAVKGDAAADAPAGPRYYDDVQSKLDAKRFLGPTTAQGSKGVCTPKYFVWKESDGTVHSWAGKTQTRLDYAFKVQGTRPYFVPSDTLIGTDILPGYTGIAVYKTDAANVLVKASLPYSFNFVAANDGIIRLDQNVNGTPIDGTMVRRWDFSTDTTVDISTVLPTKEPPSSFVNDTVVIPGGVTIPYSLIMVDVAKKMVKSVTFDGAIALQQTEHFAGGLAVSYVRNGTSGAALRVYKGGLDDAASRFELGDELANISPYLADAPNMLEHKFLTRVTTWNQKILYASAYGIWSYDLVTGALAPVQLVAGKKTAVPDVLCVLAAENLLVYRMSGDTLGQVWAVPLGSVLQ
jgi:hypothetical protein